MITPCLAPTGAAPLLPLAVAVLCLAGGAALLLALRGRRRAGIALGLVPLLVCGVLVGLAEAPPARAAEAASTEHRDPCGPGPAPTPAPSPSSTVSRTDEGMHTAAPEVIAPNPGPARPTPAPTCAALAPEPLSTTIRVESPRAELPPSPVRDAFAALTRAQFHGLGFGFSIEVRVGGERYRVARTVEGGPGLDRESWRVFPLPEGGFEEAWDALMAMLPADADPGEIVASRLGTFEWVVPVPDGCGGEAAQVLRAIVPSGVEEDGVVGPDPDPTPTPTPAPAPVPSPARDDALAP